MSDPISVASPPCYAHELADDGPDDDPAEVADWRRRQRAELIARRTAIPLADRVALSTGIAEELDRLVDIGRGSVVSAYWPFRGEPDLRDWLGRVVERGGTAALPVVVQKGRPMIFRAWHPRALMVHGVWNIPVPARGAEVVPDIVIAPLVGHDRACYRLGYGGGFFDRTLAARSPRPLVIGVGHPGSMILTIRPQPHDIPMDAIVTGACRVLWREPTEPGAP